MGKPAAGFEHYFDSSSSILYILLFQFERFQNVERKKGGKVEIPLEAPRGHLYFRSSNNDFTSLYSQLELKQRLKVKMSLYLIGRDLNIAVPSQKAPSSHLRDHFA